MITKFRGEYFFLSNFYLAPFLYRGLAFQNSESAFQSMKHENPKKRKDFIFLSPVEAKRLGHSVPIRKDWDKVKDRFMYEIVRSKFEQNADIRRKLVETGKDIIMETNTHGDRYWGVYKGKGKNKLGLILMRVREEMVIIDALGGGINE